MYHPDKIPRFLDIGKSAVITLERHKFDEYMQVIELYLSENDVYIVGNNAYSFLLNDTNKHPNSYQYKIYAPHAFKHAKALTKKLYEVKNELSKYISLVTKLQGREFSITINKREVAYITNIGIYKDVELASLITPIIKKGFYYNVKIVQFELLMIDLYRKLCNPENYKDWEDLIESEKYLYNEYKSTIGGEEKYKTQYDSIIENFIADKVQIGIKALGYGDRFQIISKNPIDDDFKVLERMIKKVFKNANCNYASNKIFILGDPRLVKNTIYIDGTPIIDIYNSAQYEPVPHINFIGTKFLILRFLLIEIWNINIISKYIKVDYTKKINLLYTIFNKERKKYKVGDYIEDYKKYYGYYISDMLYNKQKGLEKKSYPLYPYISQLFA
jgi:hypothetical protein